MTAGAGGNCEAGLGISEDDPLAPALFVELEAGARGKGPVGGGLLAV